VPNLAAEQHVFGCYTKETAPNSTGNAPQGQSFNGFGALRSRRPHAGAPACMTVQAHIQIVANRLSLSAGSTSTTIQVANRVESVDTVLWLG
jgi:hypothetical protein